MNLAKQATSETTRSSISYFESVRVYNPQSKDPFVANQSDWPAQVVDCVRSGQPMVETDDEERGHLLLPVYCGGVIQSVVHLIASAASDVVGVMELWIPTGAYEEVRLAGGCYGKLERFQNVSSFVRFEKGRGLPGQIWQENRAIVQGDLSNNAGFLRAAGASAGSLETALGIPVFSSPDCFLGSLLLISSHKTPVAKAIEIWVRADAGFVLNQAVYSDIDSGLILAVGQKCAVDDGLPGLAAEHCGAITTESQESLLDSRSADSGFESGLAIPLYDGEELTSVVSLLF